MAKRNKYVKRSNISEAKFRSLIIFSDFNAQRIASGAFKLQYSQLLFAAERREDRCDYQMLYCSADWANSASSGRIYLLSNCSASSGKSLARIRKWYSDSSWRAGSFNVWKNRYNNYSSPVWIVFATAELDKNSIAD